MKTIDQHVRDFVLSDVSGMKISIEDFIQMHNEGKAILLDVRMPFETAAWGVNFSQNIPYNELPDRLNELPEETAIVCGCPKEYRSSMAKEYLRFKGYDAKTLSGGLTALVEYLSGGKAKKIRL